MGTYLPTLEEYSLVGRSKTDQDVLWETIRCEVLEHGLQEPVLAGYLQSAILNHSSLEEALSFHLAEKLSSPTFGSFALQHLLQEAFASDGEIGACCRRDLRAVFERDPACDEYSTPFLYFKGFHALQSYRAAHHFWRKGRRSLALHLQNRIAEVFTVDIHPAARIGGGILMDHATGVVIGETAVVEDNVSILHEVTLGGTGKEEGDRHPKIRQGALIGAGAKILGNIEVGKGARVGAGSVVLRPVPSGYTVAGVPARIVSRVRSEDPAFQMDQQFVDGTWVPYWEI